MCIEEFIRMMFTDDLYGNRGLDSRTLHLHAVLKFLWWYHSVCIL